MNFPQENKKITTAIVNYYAVVILVRQGPENIAQENKVFQRPCRSV